MSSAGEGIRNVNIIKKINTYYILGASIKFIKYIIYVKNNSYYLILTWRRWSLTNKIYKKPVKSKGKTIFLLKSVRDIT